MRRSAFRAPIFRILPAFLAYLVLLLPGGHAQGAGVSLDAAVDRARQGGGRVLSAETVSEDGRRIHVIKILTEDGRVRSFAFDAATGQRLSSGAPAGRR
jgi:hypothetical protein